MKVDDESEPQVEVVKDHYFFPKFLTSRNLLELEVRWTVLAFLFEVLADIRWLCLARRSYFPSTNPYPNAGSLPISPELHLGSESESPGSANDQLACFTESCPFPCQREFSL